MQSIWKVLLLLLGLTLTQAQEYDDYFNLFGENEEVISTSTTTTRMPSTITTTTRMPTTTKIDTTTTVKTTTEAPTTTTVRTTTEAPTTTTFTTTTKQAATTSTQPPATTVTSEQFTQKILSNLPIEIRKNGNMTSQNIRLESIFLKAFKTINSKIDKLNEHFTKELEKNIIKSTTTPTTTSTPPPQVIKFLEENVFDEEFFNQKEEDVEERVLEWVNGNLKVVVGVCLLVGSICFCLPICIAIFWCISKKLRKEKSEDMEMTEKNEKDKTETDETDENVPNQEEENVYNDVSEDNPLPPVPANQQG